MWILLVSSCLVPPQPSCGNIWFSRLMKRRKIECFLSSFSSVSLPEMAFKSENITNLAVDRHRDFSFVVLMGIKYQRGPVKSVSCLVKLSQFLFGYKLLLFQEHMCFL